LPGQFHVAGNQPSHHHHHHPSHPGQGKDQAAAPPSPVAIRGTTRPRAYTIIIDVTLACDDRRQVQAHKPLAQNKPTPSPRLSPNRSVCAPLQELAAAFTLSRFDLDTGDINPAHHQPDIRPACPPDWLLHRRVRGCYSR
jgi:hypothetical protein